MKHVLFGLNQNPNKEIETRIQDKYKEKYGEEFTFDTEYYLAGIQSKLEEHPYDVLILNENLETANKVKADFLDQITDKHPGLNIIFVIDDAHQGSDFVKILFNIGIYNVLFKEDLKLSNIIELIQTSRSKKDAKIYLEIDEVENIQSEDSTQEIPEAELENILITFTKTAPDDISPVFEEIYEQYNEKQMLFLLTVLSPGTLGLLRKSNNKYFTKLDNKYSLLEEKYAEEEDQNEIRGSSKSKKNKPIIVEQEKIIYKEKIIGTVVIAVGGAERGVGCTRISLILSLYLAEHGHQVAVLDLSERGALHHLSETPEAKTNSSGGICINGVDIYDKSFKLGNILNRGYNYVILDLGRLKRLNERNIYENNPNYGEMNRADLPIFVCGNDTWQLPEADKYKGEIGEKWELVFNFNEEYGLVKDRTYIFPYIKDIFNIDKSAREFLGEFLASILPKEKKKRNWWPWHK